MTGMQRYRGEHLGSTPHRCAGFSQGGKFCGEHTGVARLRVRFPDAVIGFIGSEAR